MANWCSIEATLTLKNEEAAEKLYQTLNGKKENGCLDFNGKVIFHDADIVLYQPLCEVKIHTNVKWSLTHDDMIRFVKWLGRFVPVKELAATVNYEEPGCQIFGKYELRNGILEDYYLDQEDLPEYDWENDDDDAYCAYFDKIYAKIEAAESEVVYDFNADAA